MSKVRIVSCSREGKRQPKLMLSKDAGTSVLLAGDTALQPDVLVARVADLTKRNLPCYALHAEVKGEKVFEATTPFPVTVSPAALIRR